MTVVTLASPEDAQTCKALVEDIFDAAPVTGLSDEQLRDRVVGFAGQLAALTARFLELLAEFDTRRAWSGDGIANCAHWLSWRTGLSLRTAQEQVRVAHALTELPVIRTAFAAGRLTYSKVRALTRVATAQRERELVDVALSATATQVERLVRAMRQVDRNIGPDTDDDTNDDAEDDAMVEPPRPPAIESTGSWRWHCDGSLSVSLRLSPLDGARLLAGAVRAEYERTRIEGDGDVPRNALEPVSPDTDTDTDMDTVEPESGEHGRAQRDLWRHVPSNIAPAMVAMADTMHGAVDIPEIAPGAEILIHTYTAGAPDIDRTTTDLATSEPATTNRAASDVTTADVTTGDTTTTGVTTTDVTPANLAATPTTTAHSHADPHVDDGPALNDAEAGDACCGATIREVRRNRAGARLSWGSKRRVPNAALVRLITQRDRGCRHPGCGRTRFLHAHHVTPWHRGGTTDPDNLILLCSGSAHHRALHRGEFSIKALGGQRFSFHRTDGSMIEVAPATSAPAGWTPDPDIAPGATTPVGGGRMDLGYTTEVLYAAWTLKAWAAQEPAAAA